MSEAVKAEQVRPLGNVAPIWDYDTSDYPDRIKVPMQDGHVVSYVREIEQPHPKCMKTIDIIRVMNDCTYGYQPKHTKK